MPQWQSLHPHPDHLAKEEGRKAVILHVIKPPVASQQASRTSAFNASCFRLSQFEPSSLLTQIICSRGHMCLLQAYSADLTVAAGLLPGGMFSLISQIWISKNLKSAFNLAASLVLKPLKKSVLAFTL